MTYLLDTNACIALINAKPLSVRARLQKALDGGARAAVSTVAVFELWYGVVKSARPAFNAERVRIFLSGPLTLLPLEEGDARAAGEIRAALEAVGRPMGAYDLLLAGQASHRKFTLVTANTKEFVRVRGLLCEDWAKA